MIDGVAVEEPVREDVGDADTDGGAVVLDVAVAEAEPLGVEETLGVMVGGAVVETLGVLQG